MEINLRKFNMLKMRKYDNCVILGPLDTGKSSLVKDIMFHHQNIPAGIVFSKFDYMDNFYDEFIPSALIHDTYHSELIDKLFDRQKKALVERLRNPGCFLICDDVSITEKDLENIFFRYYDTFCIFTMQTPLAIKPDVREHLEFTFILKTNNPRERKRLYEYYADDVFPTQEIFEKVLDTCTENYGCLVIDRYNFRLTDNLEESVFYYKAEAHDDLKLCEVFWRNQKECPEIPAVTVNLV